MLRLLSTMSIALAAANPDVIPGKEGGEVNRHCNNLRGGMEKCVNSRFDCKPKLDARRWMYSISGRQND